MEMMLEKADNPRRESNDASAFPNLRKPMIVSQSLLDQSSAIG
jgi:hypothetical protein